MRYVTGGALRRALEERFRTQSLESGVPLVRLRKPGEEPLADGMVVDLDEAEEHPLAHPNCVRGWAPVVGEEAPCRASTRRGIGSRWSGTTVGRSHGAAHAVDASWRRSTVWMARSRSTTGTGR